MGTISKVWCYKRIKAKLKKKKMQMQNCISLDDLEKTIDFNRYIIFFSKSENVARTKEIEIKHLYTI